MNFNMFSNLSVHKVFGQFIVQGRRVFITNKGRPTFYKSETFLITSDEKRAWAKHNLLINCTAKLGG